MTSARYTRSLAVEVRHVETPDLNADDECERERHVASIESGAMEFVLAEDVHTDARRTPPEP